MPYATLECPTADMANRIAIKIALAMSAEAHSILPILDTTSVSQPHNRMESLERAVETCRFWTSSVEPHLAAGRFAIIARQRPQTNSGSWPEIERSLFRIATGGGSAIDIRIESEPTDHEVEQLARKIRDAFAEDEKRRDRPLPNAMRKKEGKRS